MVALAFHVRLDELDANILNLLQQDARLSYREIAERLGSTNPTIGARVKALEDIGLIRGYRAELDPSALGGTSYLLTLTAQPSAAEGALATIRDMAGVHAVHLLAGGRIVARIHLRPPGYGLTHLHKAIAQVPGIVTYDASEILEGHERARADALPQNVEVPCHQCKGPIHAEPVKGRFGERTHVFCCRQCLGTFRDRFEAIQHAAAAPPVSLRQGATTRSREAPSRGKVETRTPRLSSGSARRAQDDVMSHHRPHEHEDAHATVGTPGATHDPVCNHWVIPAKAHGTSVVKGTTVHFCSAACKRAFDKDPPKFLARFKTN